MRNLVTAIGEDGGEGGTNQLLASNSNEAEVQADPSLSEQRGDSSTHSTKSYKGDDVSGPQSSDLPGK